MVVHPHQGPFRRQLPFGTPALSQNLVDQNAELSYCLQEQSKCVSSSSFSTAPCVYLLLTKVCRRSWKFCLQSKIKHDTFLLTLLSCHFEGTLSYVSLWNPTQRADKPKTDIAQPVLHNLEKPSNQLECRLNTWVPINARKFTKILTLRLNTPHDAR